MAERRLFAFQDGIIVFVYNLDTQSQTKRATHRKNNVVSSSQKISGKLDGKRNYKILYVCRKTKQLWLTDRQSPLVMAEWQKTYVFSA